jgi:hypothetical protein
MEMFMKYNSTKIFLFFLILLLTHCNKVKYPENSSKINHPEKYELMRGSITAYNVNGIDSLDALDEYWLTHFKHSLKMCNFNILNTHQRRLLYDSNFGSFQYAWTNEYKDIFIDYYPEPGYPRRNIFIENGMSWQILKLVPSKTTVNHQLKIQSEINGKIYQIQFN